MSSVLNCPKPEEPANPLSADYVFKLSTSAPTEVEVRIVIKVMKSGRAGGADSIYAEMLKADIDTSRRILTEPFATIWTAPRIPSRLTGLTALLSNEYENEGISKTPTTGEG